MLIAEDLLLLLTDNDSGKFMVDGTALDLALAGALLLELSEHGRLAVAGKGETVKKGRLKVLSPMLTGDDTLDAALATCVEKAGKKPETVLQAVSKGLRAQLLERLAHAGILRAQRGKVLGVFPTTRWPAADSAHETQLYDRLRSVLVVGSTPDARIAALTGLLSALDAPHKVLATAGEEVDKKAVRRRAKEIREGSWAADAVGSAIAAVQAAVTAGITTSIAISAASSSGS